MLFLKIFLSAPKIFRRHKESQKRHSGAKAPQLTTLYFFDVKISKEAKEREQLTGAANWEKSMTLLVKSKQKFVTSNHVFVRQYLLFVLTNQIISNWPSARHQLNHKVNILSWYFFQKLDTTKQRLLPQKGTGKQGIPFWLLLCCSRVGVDQLWSGFYIEKTDFPLGFSKALRSLGSHTCLAVSHQQKCPADRAFTSKFRTFLRPFFCPPTIRHNFPTRQSARFLFSTFKIFLLYFFRFVYVFLTCPWSSAPSPDATSQLSAHLSRLPAMAAWADSVWLTEPLSSQLAWQTAVAKIAEIIINLYLFFIHKNSKEYFKQKVNGRNIKSVRIHGDISNKRSNRNPPEAM